MKTIEKILKPMCLYQWIKKENKKDAQYRSILYDNQKRIIKNNLGNIETIECEEYFFIMETGEYDKDSSTYRYKILKNDIICYIYLSAFFDYEDQLKLIE